MAVNKYILIALLFPFLGHSKIWFVAQGMDGDGSSWSNAQGNLNSILALAETGDQVWVKFGTYTPTQSKDRSISFIIPSGVSLYGGFEGTEDQVDQRDLSVYQTILSGNIGDEAVYTDNSYSVILTVNAESSTILDGFIIANGYADGTGLPGTPQRAGAGWYNQGIDGGSSNPTIVNCIFQNNFALEGGGLYNNATDGRCNPYIRNSAFINNRADLDGGAIFNNGLRGECSPLILDSYFAENEATYGAGILNQGAQGVVKPLISNCSFSNNSSFIKGSSIYSFNQDMSECAPIVQGCSFEENKSGVSGPSISSNISDLLFESFSKSSAAKPGLYIRSTAN
jgi:hypothetical protein